MKSKLADGHVVVWMIMLCQDPDGALPEPCKPSHYPVYPGLPYGQYSHVEPVVGILSDQPLNNTEWYEDDYIVHYTDSDPHAYYRSMQSLPDDLDFRGNCAV